MAPEQIALAELPGLDEQRLGPRVQSGIGVGALLPGDHRHGYEVREVLARLVDDSLFFEVLPDRGRVVMNGTPAELHAKSRRYNSVVVRVKADVAPKASKLLRGLPHVTAVESSAPVNGSVPLVVVPRDGRFIADEVGIAVRQNGIEVDEMHTQVVHLDEVFRQLTVGQEKPLR